MDALRSSAAIALVALLSSCDAPPPSQPEAEPAGRIEVVSLSCTARTSHTAIEATIRNTGGAEIKFPALFISVLGQTKESIARPMTLPPGSLGSISTTGPNPNAPRGSAVPCEVVAAQDSKGRSII